MAGERNSRSEHGMFTDRSSYRSRIVRDHNGHVRSIETDKGHKWISNAIRDNLNAGGPSINTCTTCLDLDRPARSEGLANAMAEGYTMFATVLGRGNTGPNVGLGCGGDPTR